MMELFLDDWHRRDYDDLVEKLWRARVWLNTMRRMRRSRVGVPVLLQGHGRCRSE